MKTQIQTVSPKGKNRFSIFNGVLVKKGIAYTFGGSTHTREHVTAPDGYYPEKNWKHFIKEGQAIRDKEADIEDFPELVSKKDLGKLTAEIFLAEEDIEPLLENAENEKSYNDKLKGIGVISQDKEIYVGGCNGKTLYLTIAIGNSFMGDLPSFIIPSVAVSNHIKVYVNKEKMWFESKKGGMTIYAQSEPIKPPDYLLFVPKQKDFVKTTKNFNLYEFSSLVGELSKVGKMIDNGEIFYLKNGKGIMGNDLPYYFKTENFSEEGDITKWTSKLFKYAPTWENTMVGYKTNLSPLTFYKDNTLNRFWVVMPCRMDEEIKLNFQDTKESREITLKPKKKKVA